MSRRSFRGLFLLFAGVVLGAWGTSHVLWTHAAAPPVAGDTNGDGQLNLSDPIHLLNFLFLGGAAPVACPDSPPPPSLALKTVVLVRHAERDPQGGADPGLTDAGKLQAEKLKEIFRDVQVDAIIASTLERTKQTVAPLANRDPAAPIPIQEYGTESSSTYDGVVDLINAQPAGTLTVVAHHSPTMPHILEALGVPEAEVDKFALGGSTYNNLFVIFLQQDGPTIFLPIRGQELSGLPVFHWGAPR